MPNIAEVVAENVLRLRERAGMSQDQLSSALRAAGLDWTRNSIAHLEWSREREPSLSELVLIASALAVPPAELLRTSAATVDVTPGVRISRDVAWSLLPKRPIRVEIPNTRRMMQEALHKFDDVKPVLPDARPATLIAVERMADEEAVKHLAASVDLAPKQVAALAYKLWRRSLSDVRDDEAGAGANAMKKAHVTRRLKAEIIDAARAAGWMEGK